MNRIKILFVEIVFVALFVYLIVKGLSNYIVQWLPDWALVVIGIVGLAVCIAFGWQVKR